MKKVIKALIWVFLLLAFVAGGIGAGLWYVWSSNLPYIGSLKEYSPPIISEIYSEDGEVIGRFWEEKRIVVPLDQVPKHLIQAFIAAEDARFFQHQGIDIPGIVRAFVKNLKAGRIEQGGSTITQQVTKSLLLKNPEKTYRRKFREAILSFQIEKNFSKEQILFLYLNQIYLGHGAYGVEAAARTYFNKSVSELSLAESALLAGLPQAPSRYSLINHFDRAKARQKYVLSRMREEGFITEEEERKALQAKVDVTRPEENPFEKAPYFTEYVRRYLVQKYGRDLLYRGGLRVYTTLDLKMQRAAQEALRKGLRELDKREGYRGPLKYLGPEEMAEYKRDALEKYKEHPPEVGDVVEGLVEKVDDERKEVIISIGEGLGVLLLSEMKWARRPDPDVPYYRAVLKKPSEALGPGDVVLVKIKGEGKGPFDWVLCLEQEPEVEGAIFCMEAFTGRVRAMVGGKDFHKSQFNRAIQAKRQPGSAFKPIIYVAAIDWGMNPSTVILDAPYISRMKPGEEPWRPKNYKEKFFGPTLLRTGLIMSRNVITVKILNTIGVDYVIRYARRMGIEADLNEDLSLALGSSGISLSELTKTYAVFANGGMTVEPIFINRIEDRDGRVIEENQPVLGEAISKETAFVMTDLLRSAIREGTGWRIRALKRPAAGKTGTTNDLRDAWFMGYTPGLVTGVWVGYDDRRPMGKGETGSRAASPIWLYFMKEVLKDKPVEDFSAPEGVVFAKIDSKTGLLAGPYSEKTVFQAFKKGDEPREYTPRPKTAKTGHFSQFDMDFSR
ncbi:MAG: PBP1A family penicillin-binding protein [Deltaproteobacteria bacterium]|nr:PBP1A family penicillin-binding protein [Deltaproteobacteria bacterium]